MATLRVLEAENERYAAVLVFLHGLWVGPALWQPLAAGFAHRGWRCALADFRSSAGTGPSFDAWCDDAAEAIAALDLPAVAIGHDAGALVALDLAARGAVCASVAAAPLLEGAAPLVDPLTRVRSRLGLGDVAPPVAGHRYRSTPTADAASRLEASLAPEPSARLGSLRGRATMPGALRVPALLVAHGRDEVVPPALIEITARGIEADSITLPGGHWPMLEPRPDAWTSTVHRWLIRTLGRPVLLLRGDEDLDPD